MSHVMPDQAYGIANQLLIRLYHGETLKSLHESPSTGTQTLREADKLLAGLYEVEMHAKRKPLLETLDDLFDVLHMRDQLYVLDQILIPTPSPMPHAGDTDLREALEEAAKTRLTEGVDHHEWPKPLVEFQVNLWWHDLARKIRLRSP